MIHELIQSPSLASRYLAEMRDETIQKDRMRFRLNLERLGECMALELSKELDFVDESLTTSLGQATVKQLVSQPVLATILRAGLPMHQGMLRMFDHADVAFAAAYRQTQANGDFTIEIDYISTGSIEGRTLILVDPMLATGASMLGVYRRLCAYGKPATVHIVAAIASRHGVTEVQNGMPPGTHIWAGAIDEELTVKGYIVPGLGDAGDLAFGGKIG
tara:strand:- start:388 stop:1038 length:651 start_codon:yes stop_codon:yes gene_type:complete